LKLTPRIKSALPYLIAVLAIILTTSVIDTSQTFQKCISDQYSRNSAGDLSKSLAVFLHDTVIYRTCTGFYFISNNAPITAIGTAAIAAFTLTLWLTSNRQARLIEQSLAADKRAFVFAANFNQTWTKDEATGIVGSSVPFSAIAVKLLLNQ
jgi:hypothetical protein